MSRRPKTAKINMGEIVMC